MRTGLLIAICLLVACSSGERPAESVKPMVVTPKPPDLSSRFPTKNQTDMKLVDDHVLGKTVLPGGNVATYKSGAKTWQLFLLRSRSAESAAILLLDLKSTLTKPKYVPAFGAYFGLEGSTPVFTLQKGPYLAGIVGLSEKEAAPVAREFAARLN